MDHYSIPYIQHVLPLVSLIGLEPNIDPKATINPSYTSQKLDVTKKIIEAWGVNEGPALWHLSAGSNSVPLTANSPALANSRDKFFSNPNSNQSIQKGTHNLFKVITQDKVSLPTKRIGQNTPGNSSPLSPNNAASPLYPDGVMTPLWCEKHQNETPAVIIMFFDLWRVDQGSDQGDDVNKLHQLLNQSSVQNTIREKDNALAQTISEYRKSMNEKGIKLIAVFWNLDTQDDFIEDRLLHIRRTSGLDPKTGFFTLDDEATRKLPDFIHSLQKSMAESCMNYYRERYKIVKKKYTRLNHLPNPLPENGLPILGWAARYEFKLATFAAFRQDFELAVKHYESCYFSLIEMLIKLELSLSKKNRWKETLAFMDCLSLNISRLMLYLESPQLSLIQLKRHLFYGKSLRLSEISGLGQPEHEYSEWMFSQYFSYAELLDCGIKFGVRFNPTSLSTTSQSQYRTIAMTSNLLLHGSPVKNRIGESKISSYSGSTFQFSSEPTNVSPNNSTVFQYDDINPISIVHHPGYYYYQAAECLIIQVDQYKKHLEEQQNTNQTSSANENDDNQSEDTITKATSTIIEVLSKSYEQFKKYRGHRMTLLVASKIAETYLNSGKYDLASKFYERIAKSYRKESWPNLLQTVLLRSLICAKNLDNSDEWFLLNSFELLSPNFSLKDSEHQDIVLGITDKLNESATKPSSEISNPIPKSVVIDLENPTTSFIYFNVIFDPKSTETHPCVNLQLQINVTKSATDAPFNLNFIKVSFRDSAFDFQFQHDDKAVLNTVSSNLCGENVSLIQHTREDSENTSKNLNDNSLRIVPTNLDLNWKGCTKVLQTTVYPLNANYLEIISIHGSLSNSNYQIVFKQKLTDSNIPSYPTKATGSSEQVAFSQLDTQSLSYNHLFFGHNPSKWLTHSEDKGLKWVKSKELGSPHSIKVQKPLPLLKLEPILPSLCLLDEPNSLSIKITNEHDEEISPELYISILNPNSGDKFLENTQSVMDSVDLIKFNLGPIKPNDSLEQTFNYIFSEIESERQISATITYSKPSDPLETKLQIEQTYTITTSKPFQVQFQFLPQFGIKSDSENQQKDASMDDIIKSIAPNLKINKEYLMVSNISGPENIDTVVEKIHWVEENEVVVSDKYQLEVIESGNPSKEQFLKSNFPFSIQNLIRVGLTHPALDFDLINSIHSSHDQDSGFKGWKVEFKKLTIAWRRNDSNIQQLNHTHITIPSLFIPNYKIEVNIDLPNQVFENQPFSIKYQIQNLTSFTRELSVSFDFNDIPLVFSGYKRKTLLCLPYSKCTLYITCHSLTYGRIFLPKLNLEEAKSNNQSAGGPSDLDMSKDINWGWDWNTTYLMVLPDQ